MQLTVQERFLFIFCLSSESWQYCTSTTTAISCFSSSPLTPLSLKEERVLIFLLLAFTIYRVKIPCALDEVQDETHPMK